LDACGSAIIGTVIVTGGEVVRPSQLIASVRRLEIGVLGTSGKTASYRLASLTAVRSDRRWSPRLDHSRLAEFTGVLDVDAGP